MLRQQSQLSWPAIMKIAIHIEPAERPFNWVDRPILVAIEFLEMVVGQFRIVRVWNSCTKMIPARIVALGALQYAMVHKIGSRLHDGFRHPSPMNFHTSRALRTCRLKLSLYRLGLLLNSSPVDAPWQRMWGSSWHAGSTGFALVQIVAW